MCLMNKSTLSLKQSRNLRDLRNQRELNQTEMARRLGKALGRKVHQQAISCHESGRFVLATDIALGYSKAHGVSLEDIVNGTS